MKRTFTKTASVIIALLILTSVFAASAAPASAVTDSQRNIVGWADYLYDTTWTAKQNVTGWRYTFSKGGTYHLPYSQPVNTNGYIGYGISIDGFLAAADDINSKLYTDSSTYNRTSTYYGMDCSSFVSLCWGVKRQTTYSIPSISTKIGVLSENIDKLQLGDGLNYRDSNEQHVILVTDLEYTDGQVTSIEITEQTPPQLKRTTYTRAALLNRYSYYIAYRYTGTVPDPPAGYKETYLLGDISGDGIIDAVDATIILRSAAHITVSFDESRKSLGDIDGDGEISAVDATFIQRYDIHMNVPYPIGEPI